VIDAKYTSVSVNEKTDILSRSSSPHIFFRFRLHRCLRRPETSFVSVSAHAVMNTGDMQVEVAAVDVSNDSINPLDNLPPNYVRDGDYVVLKFADGKQVFAQALKRAKGKTPPVKLFKRSYATHHLIGLPFGTVLELTVKGGLKALPDGEDLLPGYPVMNDETKSEDDALVSEEPDISGAEDVSDLSERKRDNRHLLDTNTSQALGYQDLATLRDEGVDGSIIVSKIIQNSSTFDQKTDFSRAKYVARKQIKYQPRCRLIKGTGGSICSTVHMRDPKRIMNLRDDTLAQLLGYSNISAGCQCLVLENCSGVITGALAQRIGGYGKILSVYSGQQPAWSEMLSKFNLSFAENNTIKWLHASDVFGAGESEEALAASEAERIDREKLEWPCVLQDHTRRYLKTMKTDKEKKDFLEKRAGRFARKLTRHTATEAAEWLKARQCDSLIIASKYDPTETLMHMLQFLAPSCPFVVYSEFIEPLTECFQEVQQQGVAINLRLSDTWTREYQVLPGRTHPNMTMSQSGGFILTGVKLDPEFGKNEIDEETLKDIRAAIGGRRGKKAKSNDGKEANTGDKRNGRPSKRRKIKLDA
jgi:tRNA (adenine-N(1)-)-methyltransferase non-catalytic subunit